MNGAATQDLRNIGSRRRWPRCWPQARRRRRAPRSMLALLEALAGARARAGSTATSTADGRRPGAGDHGRALPAAGRRRAGPACWAGSSTSSGRGRRRTARAAASPAAASRTWTRTCARSPARSSGTRSTTASAAAATRRRARGALWGAFDAAGGGSQAAQGSADPDAWVSDANAERITFAPGLLPTTIRYTNRPSGIQQVISFMSHRPRRLSAETEQAAGRMARHRYHGGVPLGPVDAGGTRRTATGRPGGAAPGRAGAGRPVPPARRGRRRAPTATGATRTRPGPAWSGRSASSTAARRSRSPPGMAAVSAVLFTQLKPGDVLVAAGDGYPGVRALATSGSRRSASSRASSPPTPARCWTRSPARGSCGSRRRPTRGWTCATWPPWPRPRTPPARCSRSTTRSPRRSASARSSSAPTSPR